MHLGARDVQLAGDHRDRIGRDVADLVLDAVQDGEHGTGHVLALGDDAAHRRHVENLLPLHCCLLCCFMRTLSFSRRIFCGPRK
jgi:hypothetical protein